MKAKGLLDLASSLESATKNRQEDNIDNNFTQITDTQKEVSVLQTSDNAIPMKIESNKAYEIIPDNVIIVATQNKSNDDKLVSYENWKKTKNKLADSTLNNGPPPYEHELVSYSSWRDKVDLKYESIKKQVIGTILESSETEEDDDIEELLPEIPFTEDAIDEEGVNTDTEILALSNENIQSSLKGEATQDNSTLSTQAVLSESRSMTPVMGKSRHVIVVRRKRRTLFADIVTVVACLASAFICLYTFYNSLNRSLGKVNEEPVATITFKYKSAQRKLSDRVLWDRIKQNSPVYDGDIIRTADLSEATITFHDGNVINLYEQSLIQVSYDENGAAVEFTGGQIAVDSSAGAEGIKLLSGDTTVEVTVGSAVVASAQTQLIDGVLSKDINAPMKLQVSSGDASVISSNGLTDIVLQEGSSLALDSKGETLAEPSVSVYSPQINAKYLMQQSETMPVDFKWSIPSDSTETYVLELSKNIDFSAIEETKDITGLNTVDIALGEGMWYWRMYSELPGEGEEGKFRIIKSDIPKTIIPSQNEQYTYTIKPPAIRFMWSEDVYATEWLLQIADNAQMENPHVEQLTTQVSSIVTSLEEGIWYWRVIPTYPKSIISDNSSDRSISSISSFIVSQNESLSPVNLRVPQNHDFVNTTTSQSFSWEHDNEAEYYTLSLSRNKDMTSVVFSEDVERNYYQIKTETNILTPGLWYWSVTKSDEEDNVFPSNEIRSFLALEGEFVHEVLTPRNNDIISEKEIESTLFTWENNLPYDTFIQVAQNENFENLLIETKTDSDSLRNISLPVGKWYWRIVSKDTEEGIEYTSLHKQFYIEYDLDPVSLREPSPNETLVLIPSSEVLFLWDSVQNAEYYEFKLFNENDTQNAVYENLRIERTNHSINMFDLPTGEYRYTLQAVRENTPSLIARKSDAQEAVFSTRIIEPLQLTGPTNGFAIDGVTALVEPPSVRWSSSERVVRAEFILSKSESGLSAAARQTGNIPQNTQVRLRVEDPSTTIELPPLTEGTWYWTVVGETEGGYDISARQPLRIIVRPIEKLPAAILSSPVQGEVFNVEYLYNNTFIDFTWDAVQDAGEYIFTLRSDTNEVVFEKIFEKETTFHFEDLSVLDRGTFTWTIEATRNLPENVVQRGEIASYTFVIDIPQLTIPQNKTQGDLYGL